MRGRGLWRTAATSLRHRACARARQWFSAAGVCARAGGGEASRPYYAEMRTNRLTSPLMSRWRKFLLVVFFLLNGGAEVEVSSSGARSAQLRRSTHFFFVARASSQHNKSDFWSAFQRLWWKESWRRGRTKAQSALHWGKSPHCLLIVC